METLPETTALSTRRDGTACEKSYGLPSWFFFVAVGLVNLIFLATQVLINLVRDGQVTVAALDQGLYAGAYWLIATAGLLSLLVSGFLLGLTLAVIVVRAWLHYAPCRAYAWLLLVQAVPWVYFGIAAL
jgi:hypothetical protein